MGYGSPRHNPLPTSLSKQTHLYMEWIKKLFGGSRGHFDSTKAYNIFRFGVDASVEEIIQQRCENIEDHLESLVRRGESAVIKILDPKEEDVNDAVIAHFTALGYTCAYLTVGNTTYLVITPEKGVVAGGVFQKKEEEY